MEANVLDCGRFRREEGCNVNADGFGLIVQRKGCWCWSGWREVGGDRGSKENGQEIWGENGGDGGWPLPNNKKLQKKGLARAFIRWSLCCFPWGPQWELGDCYSAEAH